MFESSVPAPSIPRAVVQYMIESAIVLADYLVWLALLTTIDRLLSARLESELSASSLASGLGFALGVVVASLAALAVSARGSREPTSIFAGKAGLWVWAPPVLCVVYGMLQMGNLRLAWESYFVPPPNGERGLYLLFFTLPAFSAVVYSTARAVFRRALRAKAPRTTA